MVLGYFDATLTEQKLVPEAADSAARFMYSSWDASKLLQYHLHQQISSRRLP